jgi:hypothetical protein
MRGHLEDATRQVRVQHLPLTSLITWMLAVPRNVIDLPVRRIPQQLYPKNSEAWSEMHVSL